jgi:sugar phosphate isomerase/epimerase
MNIVKTLLLSFMPFSFSFLSAQEIGLELYSLRNEFKTDVPGTLARVKSWGINEVEIHDTYGLSREEFKKRLDQNELKVVSVAADFDKLATNPQAAVEEAKFYGARYVVCFWIPHKGDEFGITDMKKAVAVFNSAGKVLLEHGLSLCYHPHGFEFRPYSGGTLFDYMVKNTNPRYVNYEMDVFWVKHPGQDPVALLKKYPRRFVLLHLKDRQHGTPGNQDGRADDESNVVLGKGDVGIAAIMRQAKKNGVKHYFIEDESSRSVQQVPQSLAYLKSLNKSGRKRSTAL